MKKQYRPKLDPKVDLTGDLTGATPEALVRALFRWEDPLPPCPAGQSVVGDEPVRDRSPSEPAYGTAPQANVQEG